MGKNTLFLVVLMFFAGATGGVFSFLLARSGSDGGGTLEGSRPPAKDSLAPAPNPVVSEVDWLAMRNDVSDLTIKVKDLTAQLEVANAKLEEASASARADGPVGELLAKGLTSGPVRWTSGDKDGLAATGLRIPGMAKVAELMALPEEERWAKIREDLSLDAYQESELKRIADEMKKDSMGLLAQGENGEVRLDPMEFIGKMVAKRKKANEQVKNLLTDDQYKKFNEGGYGAALGLGSTSVAISYSNLGAPGERRDK